jgi:Na+/H+-dicarboxylate symporter
MVSAELRDQLASAGAAAAGDKLASATAPDVWSTFLNIVPTNPFAALAEGNMLQVVFFALAVGVSLTLVAEEKANVVMQAASAMTDVIIKLVHVIMLVAPYAVFALLAKVVAQLGLDVLSALAVYSLVVVAGLATMIFVVYPTVLRLLTPIGFGRFFRAIAPAQLLAFSSASSSATLPVTMECAEERLGISEEVASFALPLGATINMDGTALYQGVAALFIAQLYGIDLDLGAQLTIVLTATLASIGTAGVPGVGLIMLVIVLQAVGMSQEVMAGGVAIIFGVDRVLDMCRTATNVTGDCMVASYVAASEGALLSEEEVEARLRRMAQVGLDEHPLG